jgi:hypothetical protein
VGLLVAVPAAAWAAIVTNRQTTSASYSRLAGVDGNVWFSPALKGELLAARTFNPDGARTDDVGIGRLLFSARNIVADIRYSAVGPCS